MKRTFLRRLVIVIIVLGCISLGALALLFERNLVDFSTLDTYKSAKPSTVFDDEGNVLAHFALDKRAPIAYSSIPDILIRAFVATEDHDFFKHIGISFRGIIRSILVNLYHRRVVQGASTITQQLARMMFLSYERTWYRKIREIMLAMQLEQQFSKEQILELYLNNIYFGRGIYGVEAACRRFWNKSLNQLTAQEAATLAAVAASARLYSPLNAPGNAKKRRDAVLKKMGRLGFITPEMCETSIKSPLRIQDYAPGNPVRLYVQEWIRMWAEEKWGKDVLYRQGLKIKTTINSAMQAKAEEVFVKIVHKLRHKMGDDLNGGLMSIVPETGEIKVMIGGYDFRQSQFNRATQAYRQMGSSFKPMLFALAIKAGIGMESVFFDEPYELSMPHGAVYQPKNWDNLFDGPMTLVRALTFSRNIIAIKLFLKIGGSYVIPWVKQFGINRQVTDYPSAALGTAEATVEENVAAFNVFANNGVYVKPYVIEWVKDASGFKIWQSTPQRYRVLDTKLNSQMVNVLSHRMNLAKRQSRDGWFDAESLGKTGSTNGAATTWFVGATPTLTTATYLGRDDNKPMGNQLLASRTAFPLWVGLYKSLTFSKKHFYIDPTLKEYPVNWVTGEPSDKIDDPDVIVLLK